MVIWLLRYIKKNKRRNRDTMKNRKSFKIKTDSSIKEDKEKVATAE
jgi:hypothetical protein